MATRRVIAGQVLEDAPRSAKRRLGVNHPIDGGSLVTQGTKGSGGFRLLLLFLGHRRKRSALMRGFFLS